MIGTEASLAIEAPAADETAAPMEKVVVYVFVRKNRDGTVVDYHLDKPSVYDLLNEEILALIVQAQLLPPSPEVRGDIVEFVVPVAFSLQR